MPETVRKTFRAESRKDYGQFVPKDTGFCIDQLRLGCEFRSADALEEISQSLREMRWMSNRDRQELYDSRAQIAKLKKTIKKQKDEIVRLKQ
jgi:hypothetical protein